MKTAKFPSIFDDGRIPGESGNVDRDDNRRLWFMQSCPWISREQSLGNDLPCALIPTEPLLEEAACAEGDLDI